MPSFRPGIEVPRSGTGYYEALLEVGYADSAGRLTATAAAPQEYPP